MPATKTLRKKTEEHRKLRQADKPEAAPEPVPEPEQLTSVSDALLAILVDFPKFAESFLKVQTKAGDLVSFELNTSQIWLEKIREKIRSSGRLIRMIVLKARREGVSTWVSGRFYWKTISNKNRYSMIICHEPDSTDFVFNMHKRFQLHLPEAMRPTERYNNKKMLQFQNEAGTGLDSAVRVGTAGKEDFGSGQLIHYLHLSELAKYPRATTKALLTSLFQCVPPLPDTEIYIESTAKGVGGEFYARFWGCKYRYEMYLDENHEVQIREVINENALETNEYTAVFIPWFIEPEYSMTAPESMELIGIEDEKVEFPDEHYGNEKLIKKKYNLTMDQMYWRRWYIDNHCDGKLETFNQEYPDDPMNAFISASDNVFPTKLLQRKIKEAQPPKSRYDVQLATGNWIHSETGKFQVWNEPISGREYIVSGDIAEGLAKGDFSSLDVLDCFTGLQVAHWHGKIPPDQFAYLMTWAGKRYNTALLVPERNNHGATVVSKLQDIGYPKIYMEMVTDQPPMRPRKRFGFVTTDRSKPMLIDGLEAELREGLDGIQCAETFEEMVTFKQFEDGTLGAEEGFYDDRVMSIAIARFVRSKIPRYNRQKIGGNPLVYYNNSVSANKQPKVTPDSWS